MARDVKTAVDAFNLYVAAQDLNQGTLSVTATNSPSDAAPTLYATNAVLIANATATGTQQSLDLTNTVHRGIAVFIDLASLSVDSATLAVNLLGKAPVSGNYAQIGRVSLDGLTNGNANSCAGVEFYPGLTGNNRDSVALPQTFALQASLTLVTTAGMSGLASYRFGGSKML